MKKPSLSDLAAKKPAAAVEAMVEPLVARAAPAKRAGEGSGAYVGTKAILVRVKLEGWRQLRDLAAELTIATGDQVSMQSLLVDAVNDVLKRHGRPPVA